MANASPQPANRRGVLLGALAAAVYLWVCAFMVLNGGINVDEGFYGICSRAALSGRLPYRDFGYTQMPLYLYVNGAVMKLIGFGFLQQRLVSALCSVSLAACGAAFLWRRRGMGPALAFTALLASGLQWMYFGTLGKTDAFVALLVLAASVVALSAASFQKKILWVSMLGTVAVGSRLPVAPFFAVLWAALLARDFSPKNAAVSLLCPTLLGAILIAPFIAAAPRSFVFWTMDFHQASHGVKNWHINVADLFPVSPAMSILWLAFAAALVARRIKLIKPVDGVLAALVVALACNVLPTGAYPEYAVPFVPAFILVLVDVFCASPINARWRHAALAACVAANLCVRAPIDRSIVEKTRKAASIVRSLQQEPVPFAGSAALVALESGSPVDDRMTMDPFCCTESLSEADAEAFHLITPAGIARLMADPKCNVVVLYADKTKNIIWSMPEFSAVSKPAVDEWKSILSKGFVLGYGDDSYAVFVRRSSDR